MCDGAQRAWATPLALRIVCWCMAHGMTERRTAWLNFSMPHPWQCALNVWTPSGAWGSRMAPPARLGPSIARLQSPPAATLPPPSPCRYPHCHFFFPNTASPYLLPPPCRYPHCLFFLDLVQSSEFRTAVANNKVSVRRAARLYQDPVLPVCRSCPGSL